MALKPCVECNSPISTNNGGKPCPRCGHVDPHHQKLHTKLFGLVIAVVGVGFIYFHFLKP